MGKNLKVLFLSPEVVPFAKTGGLADVAGALPVALKRIGVDVRLVLPFYRRIRDGHFDLRPLLKNLEIPLGGMKLPANVVETQIEDGVPVYLLEREDLYDRPNLYGNAVGDYYDNIERFSFFAHGALRLMEQISFKPDIVHCHDWQSGLVPVLIKGPYRNFSNFRDTASVFTIHNLGYAGIFLAEKLAVTGLPKADFFHPEGLEFWGNMSLLKSGIVYAEAITTVSPTYAKEIQTPDYGMGMEGILRRRKALLHGILNGVDYRLWDPLRDTHIPARYSPQEMAGKAACKISLIKEMGVSPMLKNKPLLGMVSRLDVQKGLDLLVQVLDDILDLDVGLVVLGSGDHRIQQAIFDAAGRHPGRVGLKIGFDEALAHRIMAGADVFLIPSRYEPCGLTQMYALKYGTIPLVRATGGLDDTVVPFEKRTGEGNGFKFVPYESKAFLNAIRQCADLYQDSNSWRRLMGNAMKADFSWDRSARSYLELYESVQEK